MKKDHQLHMRISKDHLDKIKSNAKDSGMSISDYILHITGIEKSTYQHKEIFTLLTKLVHDDKRVENNINQVAKHLNQNSERISDQVIREYIDMVGKYMNKRDRIKRTLGKLIALMASLRS